MSIIQGMPNLGPGLRLHLNENTAGCSPKVLEAIRGVSAEDVSTYPDYEAAVRETASHIGADPDWLVLTNGLDEGLLLTAIGYLTPRAPDALVELGALPVAPSGQPEQIIVLPAFEPYIINAKALGARTISIPAEADFAFPLAKVLAAISPNTRLVFINTPHNPSGRPVSEADIRAVIAAAPHALVFIDEAYHDFQGVNFLSLTGEFPNVMVGRTMSKAYGLAGIRVGLVVASPALLAPIRYVMPLFNLNSVAVAALRAAVADTQFMPASVAEARTSKALLYEALTRLGLPHWTSETNFVLVNAGEQCQELVAGLRATRRAGARPQQGTRLRGVLPHHRRPGRPHQDGHRRAGGVVRKGLIDRKTAETHVKVALTLEGRGRFDNHTGVRFLDHMLDLVARHGAFDLAVTATGDLDVDQHHTVEDIGIALGQAVDKALGDRKGINRAGYFVMPMDETLAVVAIDLGGRPHTVVDTKVRVRLVGDLQTELVTDFFEGFASAARANVHVKVMHGRSNHHKIEACFKAFARALRVACAKDARMARMLPSTKGLL